MRHRQNIRRQNEMSPKSEHKAGTALGIFYLLWIFFIRARRNKSIENFRVTIPLSAIIMRP
jgi:hypothetical protein